MMKENLIPLYLPERPTGYGKNENHFFETQVKQATCPFIRIC